MEEEKTAELEAKNKAEGTDAKEGAGVETDGGKGAGDGSGTDVEKKDYSQMTDEDIVNDLKTKHADATPDELMSELAKQMKIIGHKNRAINSLKKPKEDADEQGKGEEKKEVKVEDLDKPLTRRDLMEFNNRNAIKEMASSATKDDAEKKAILDAYNNDIVKSGDVAKDFKKALAIASADAISEYRKNRSMASENENFMTGFSAGNSYGNNSGDAVKTQKQNALASNLKKAGFDQKQIDAELAKL